MNWKMLTAEDFVNEVCPSQGIMNALDKRFPDIDWHSTMIFNGNVLSRKQIYSRFEDIEVEDDYTLSHLRQHHYRDEIKIRIKEKLHRFDFFGTTLYLYEECSRCT